MSRLPPLIAFLLAAAALVFVAVATLGDALVPAWGASRPLSWRAFGYSHDDVMRFLTSVGWRGRRDYVTYWQKLDAILPLLFFVGGTVMATIVYEMLGLTWLSSRLFALVTVAPTTFLDIAEKMTLSAILHLAPEAVTADLVGWASFFTMSKWTTVMVGASGALFGLLWGVLGEERNPAAVKRAA